MDKKVLREKMKYKGHFKIEVFDKDGNFVSESECDNIITDEGLNYLLNVGLEAVTQITAWKCIMFEDDTAAADGSETYAVPVYNETTAYAPGLRPGYMPVVSSAESITNSANKAVFTMNATKTLYGAALVGGGSAAGTKDDTAGGGTLLCIGTFGTAQPVIDTNVVNLTYTVTSADDAV